MSKNPTLWTTLTGLTGLTGHVEWSMQTAAVAPLATMVVLHVSIVNDGPWKRSGLVSIHANLDDFEKMSQSLTCC